MPIFNLLLGSKSMPSNFLAWYPPSNSCWSLPYNPKGITIRRPSQLLRHLSSRHKSEADLSTRNSFKEGQLYQKRVKTNGSKTALFHQINQFNGNAFKYTWLKKGCREKKTNHKRYDPVVCWETSELFTDLHFESRLLALFVCFNVALCASVTHVPDSERMVGGRT